MTIERKQVGVLISGRGSNLQALIAAAQAKDYPAEIALVISNRSDAKGLEHARNAGIAAKVVDHKGFGTRADFDTALIEALEAAGVELIALAGFMRLFTPGFTAHWHDRMINIHPSLLPLFPGLDPHGQQRQTGLPGHAGAGVLAVPQGRHQGLDRHRITIHQGSADGNDAPSLGAAPL